jgi:hypothetical protein
MRGDLVQAAQVMAQAKAVEHQARRLLAVLQFKQLLGELIAAVGAAVLAIQHLILQVLAALVLL